LAAKTAKVIVSNPAGEKKAKEQKEKKGAEPEFINTTPPGQKKGAIISKHPFSLLKGRAQTSRRKWLMGTTLSPSNPLGTTGGMHKVFSHPNWLPTGNRNQKAPSL
jgi:hypothetical protein